jgi:hypothetical protein
VPPGAPCNLADLVGVQAPPLAAVELDQAGQGDVADVHVQAHSDRVGRDQMVDLARLIQRHLSVARARAERAEHHRGAAAPAAHQLGERVDFLGRERDHGAAPGQPRHLGRLDVGQGGETRPADQLGLGHQLPDQRADGVGAQEHGLVAPARAQQPVGEHVAALGIGAQLDLVDREEARLEVVGHGLDRGDEVARRGRLDPFLAGDQGDGAGPPLCHDPVVDLARQEAQRETDQATPVPQHPLDREVGLAGVGRPEDREHARPIVRHQRHGLTIGAWTLEGKSATVAKPLYLVARAGFYT